MRQADNDALYALFHRLEFTRLMQPATACMRRRKLPEPQESRMWSSTCAEIVTDAARARRYCGSAHKKNVM